jgi:hypothetical protein
MSAMGKRRDVIMGETGPNRVAKRTRPAKTPAIYSPTGLDKDGRLPLPDRLEPPQKLTARADRSKPGAAGGTAGMTDTEDTDTEDNDTEDNDTEDTETVTLDLPVSLIDWLDAYRMTASDPPVSREALIRGTIYVASTHPIRSKKQHKRMIELWRQLEAAPALREEGRKQQEP